MTTITSRLSKGMYGNEFGRTPETALFLLKCGQMRGRDLVHNGGWYNRAGEKLGWGDLEPADFQRIAEELEEGELFIILSESDSFWNFVTHNPGSIGSRCATSADVNAPGVDYVAEKAMYIIGRMELYIVDRWGSNKSDTTRIEGLTFKRLTKDAAKALIVDSATTAS
jgi:hypothetical protein